MRNSANQIMRHIRQVLAAKSTDNLNNLNNEGHTPLHLSCQWDKPDCVKALLAAGADANIQSEKTKGFNHNSKSECATTIIIVINTSIEMNIGTLHHKLRSQSHRQYRHNSCVP